MTFYEPQLTLTVIDPVTNEYQLTYKIYYPAGESGTMISNTVSGSVRNIEVKVVSDPSAQYDHYVTSDITITRQPGENEVDVTVKKDGKKKGQTAIVYTREGRSAA